MQIELPEDVERDILKEIHSGRFPSIDAAIVEAWRSFQERRPTQVQPQTQGLIGALRDDAEWLDQAVEHAMKVREERPWRMKSGE